MPRSIDRILEEDGFEFHRGFLDIHSVNSLIADIELLDFDYPKHGIRNAEKKLPSLKELVDSELLRNTAKRYLTADPSLVRVIVFDKTPEKNWLVTWHQDKTIAVNNKVEQPNWGPWSVKDGIHHVQPSVDVLNNMITLRLHLDDADESNGCLKVIPKSHTLGILKKPAIDRLVGESQAFSCAAQSGDLLLMRPHLLHASSKGSSPKHRRVVHVEYSAYTLPNELSWA